MNMNYDYFTKTITFQQYVARTCMTNHSLFQKLFRVVE